MSQPSQNTQLLQQLIQIVQRLETRLDSLETRMDTRFHAIESRLDYFEQRFVSFQHNVSLYMKKESDFQENIAIQLLYRFFQTSNPMKHVYIHPLKYIYLPNGKELTDIDGCIVLDTSPPVYQNRSGMKQYKNRMNAFDTLRDVTPTFRNNKNVFLHANRPFLSEAFILECKHSLNLQKIIDKMVQIHKFKQILSSLSTINTSNPSFQSMIDEYSLSSFPNETMYLLFVSDDLTDISRDYIRTIYSGITPEQHDHFVYSFFREDTYLKSKMRDMYNMKKISQKVYQQFTSIKDLKKLIAFASKTKLQENELSQLVKEFSIYSTRFEDIEDIYKTFHDKIGYFQFHDLWFPKFQTFTDGILSAAEQPA